MVSDRLFGQWEKEFRAAAEKDRFKVFQSQLKRLKMSNPPETMLEGTIVFIAATLAYLSLDGRKDASRDFLEMQKYDPAASKKAKYALTFNVCGHSCARFLVNSSLCKIDLADLLGHPWGHIKFAGYSELRVSRTDKQQLTPVQSRKLQKAIEEDIRFDYSEDELTLWFIEERGHLVAWFQHEP